MDVILCDPGHTEDAWCGVLPGYRSDGSIIVKGVATCLGDTPDHAHNVDGTLTQVTGALDLSRADLVVASLEDIDLDALQEPDTPR